ncbi:four-carbon acid sugar kinase family protein [Reichenbachiella versicolor]|uniref:four-carbon acid sugar kinase family protein n=1 Tax=Reichenbachiella versicolor TaxID=1821036 RepID=UPI0013A5A648|nr:four-carbon acid sugar kinase family protein [Reichenbachiella versicolor]
METETNLTYESLVDDLPEMVDLPSTNQLLKTVKESADVIIVLDDDPTGTQTVHDIPVLTEWTFEAIVSELKIGTPLFYILTNSRSLPENQAKKLGLEIAHNIKQATQKLEKKHIVISRSDSTLRGHYPLEIDILNTVFKPNKAVQFLIPAFFEGGRYTINDIHYVKEGIKMTPAHLTPFAKDKVFGFKNSQLIKWVSEKYNGELLQEIHSLTLSEIRSELTDVLCTKVNRLNSGDICIVNAINYDDLKKVIFAILQSEVTPLFRTAASTIATFTQQDTHFITNKICGPNSNGGLIVLGSYVPKSTQQLNHTLKNTNLHPIKVNVNDLLKNQAVNESELAKRIDYHIEQGTDVILYTSRELVSSSNKEKNLDIGSTVSKYLTNIVSILDVKPRYVIAKGGITSSDLATKSLKIKRALVKGQLIPGVPVWEQLADSKFPGIPYIIFPGNVGNESSLTEAINKLTINLL